MDDFGLDVEEEYVSNTSIATSIYEHQTMNKRNIAIQCIWIMTSIL